MFRVVFSEEHRKLVYKIAGDKVVEEVKHEYDDGAIITVDGSEKEKELFRATRLCGRGIAILGMRGFDPDEPRITFHFPDVEAAANFKSWLCNSGEQSFWIDYPEEGQRNLDFEYHDPGGCDVIATYVEDE